MCQFLVYPVQKLARPSVTPLPQKSTSVSEHPRPTAPSANLASKSPDLTGESSSSGSPQSSPDGQVVTLQPTLIPALSLQCYLDRRSRCRWARHSQAPSHTWSSTLEIHNVVSPTPSQPATYLPLLRQHLAQGPRSLLSFYSVVRPQVWCDWQPN